MSPKEQAVFDNWLENYATEDERTLPYDKQVEAHIFWLTGEGHSDLELIEPEAEEQFH